MSIWQTIKRYATQLGIIYNAVGKTYNEANYNYAGKLSTLWSNRTKN